MYRREWLKRSWKLAAGGAGSLVVLDAFGVSGSDSPTSPTSKTRRASRAMGTHINTTAVGPDQRLAKDAIDAGLRELEAVDRLMTIHSDDSDLGRLNARLGSGDGVDVRTLEVALVAQRYAEMTDGALDPTILPLMRHWGFMERRNKAPSPEGLEEVLDRVGYRGIRVAGNRIALEPGTEVDFGGVAKGYGVDCAVERAKEVGVRDLMLEAGGDLYAAGRPDPDRRWTVGIRDPLHPDKLFATIDVEDEAVATSGGYEKFRVLDGRRITHLLDPRTGSPVEGVISSTIIAASTMEADALSTATFVAGIVPALDLVTPLAGVEGLWVDNDGRRWMTPGLKGRVRFV